MASAIMGARYRARTQLSRTRPGVARHALPICAQAAPNPAGPAQHGTTRDGDPIWPLSPVPARIATALE
jgi:hypothetical protein